MAIVLGDNQYGKVEVRLLHVSRDDAQDVITDLNVSVALSGELTATHLTGDNSDVLTTDAQKNTVFAFRPEIAEMRLSLPNKHHFEVDMSPFGLESQHDVFYAADRPYGLIEGTVTRDDAPPPGKAW